MLRNLGHAAALMRRVISYGGTATTRSMVLRKHRAVFERLEPRLQLDAGPLVISELMAVNTETWADENGQFSDWI